MKAPIVGEGHQIDGWHARRAEDFTVKSPRLLPRDIAAKDLCLAPVHNDQYPVAC